MNLPHILTPTSLRRQRQQIKSRFASIQPCASAKILPRVGKQLTSVRVLSLQSTGADVLSLSSFIHFITFKRTKGHLYFNCLCVECDTKFGTIRRRFLPIWR
ncbi:hypothetical protein CDAR_374851 [Caerostris darwini]|uniref:Uncharacterized protein n=1 Tax=Caerostris darwini TaxID=1538125 RepID=A0AAV4RKP1_9ARAC|nr:hypothetical protein CDAR_374851 [Caerostris darwini]